MLTNVNKTHEISSLIYNQRINIMAVSETHLDHSVNDASVAITDYNVFRNDRNRFGGGVALYVQNHIPVKVRSDLTNPNVECLCLEIHIPHCKPVIAG